MNKRVWAAGAVGVGTGVWLWARERVASADSDVIEVDPNVNPPATVHGKGVRELSPFEKWALSGHIPKVDLDNTRLHVGELPFWANWVINPAAITIGNDVYFRDVQHFVSPNGLAIMAHELVHVGQYRRGMSRLGYLWSNRYGYSHDNEFEKPAYDMAVRVQHDMHTKLRGIDFGV